MVDILVIKFLLIIQMKQIKYIVVELSHSAFTREFLKLNNKKKKYIPGYHPKKLKIKV